MKFNIITLIWSMALILLTFNICLLAIDWQFTNTIVYKFMLVLNGIMLGLVVAEWSNNA
jgi:hypothetical protein